MADASGTEIRLPTSFAQPKFSRLGSDPLETSALDSGTTIEQLLVVIAVLSGGEPDCCDQRCLMKEGRITRHAQWRKEIVELLELVKDSMRRRGEQES